MGAGALLDMLRADTAVRKIDLNGCEGVGEAVRKEVERLAPYYPPRLITAVILKQYM